MTTSSELFLKSESSIISKSTQYNQSLNNFKMKKQLIIILTLCLSTVVFGQRNAKSEYWNTWRFTPKADKVQKFEAAVALKTKTFNSTPESGIITYKVLTGPFSGAYERIEANKKPADYDLDRSIEAAYWDDNVGKYIASEQGQKRWVRLKNESYNFDPTTTIPSKYITRTVYEVKADKVLHFRRMMSRITKMMELREMDAQATLFRLVSGGSKNQFVRVVGFSSYEQVFKSRETSWEDDYNELFGWGSWDEDANNFDASLEMYGEKTETLQLMPQLSSGMMN